MTRSTLSQMSLVIVVTMVLLLSARGDAAAQQSSPRFGTWKWNAAKSTPSPFSPKSLMRTDEPSGDGVKVAYDGIDADGSRIAYFYTARYDGQEYRPTGVGMGNGWETISLKRIDDYSYEGTLKRGGEVVSRVKVVISKDGKTMTQTVEVRNPAGQPIHSISVWDKQ